MQDPPMKADERSELLADVAEMYYEEGLTQVEVAERVGVTRSAISRMLTEARERGIVEIRVIRPLRFDYDLSGALRERFDISDIQVVKWAQDRQPDALRDRLGKVGARKLAEILTPNVTLGVPWGTTVAATIDALEVKTRLDARVVQLIGVLGSTSHAYNGQALVERLAHKVDGQGVYLYTPGIVENVDTARSLRNNPDIRHAIDAGRECDIALLGVGTTDLEFSSLYLGGHVSRADLNHLTANGAVGDISGYFFDINGRLIDTEFHDRLVGIPFDDLLRIPVRMAVAGGPTKHEALLGALRGRLITILVTDSVTAARILELDT
jgi:deoxyribonucleoside regulator